MRKSMKKFLKVASLTAMVVAAIVVISKKTKKKDKYQENNSLFIWENVVY